MSGIRTGDHIFHRPTQETWTVAYAKGRDVVCYYAHPRLDGLYPHWTRREIIVHKRTSNQCRRGISKTKATEILLINGPSYATAEATPLFEGAAT